MLTWSGYLGAALVLALAVWCGVWTSRRARGAPKSTQQVSSWLVTGTLVGVLAGGTVAIGTAQLAYVDGWSAWWFTLGGGIGLALMVIAGYVRKTRAMDREVRLAQLVGREFGPTAARCVAVFAALAGLVALVAALMAGVAVVDAASPLGAGWTIALVAALIVVCAAFGGATHRRLGWATAAVIVILVVVCGALALHTVGGWSGLHAATPGSARFSIDGTGLGIGVSLVLGVLTQQGLAQTLRGTPTLRATKASTSIAAVLVPVVGAFGVVIGLSMRADQPDARSGSALPLFVVDHLPDALAGVVLMVLLVAVVGTAAVLGPRTVATLTRDLSSRQPGHRKPAPRLTYGTLVALLVLAGLLTALDSGGLILSWGIWSARLIGLAGFVPLTAALFWPGRLGRRWAVAASVTGPIVALLGAVLLPLGLDPVWPGAAASLLVLGVGLAVSRITGSSDARPHAQSRLQNPARGKTGRAGRRSKRR